MNPRFADLVAIGRFVRPQGRKGELCLEPLSDHPDRFTSLRRAFVPGPGGSSRQVEVTGCWPHKRRVVVKLSGVDSIDQAETFRGLDLRIEESELPSLPEGCYYHHQLRGLTVSAPDGSPIGKVVELLEIVGAPTVLVVRGTTGETLIPLAEPFIRVVDLATGRLVAERPELVEASRAEPRRPAC
jgi:16S rRNA processing protein RimM